MRLFSQVVASEIPVNANELWLIKVECNEFDFHLFPTFFSKSWCTRPPTDWKRSSPPAPPSLLLLRPASFPTPFASLLLSSFICSSFISTHSPSVCVCVFSSFTHLFHCNFFSSKRPPKSLHSAAILFVYFSLEFHRRKILIQFQITKTLN